VSEADDITLMLYKKLCALRHKKDTLLLTKDVNGVLLDKDNLVYSYDNHQVIGYMKNKSYYIHKREFYIDIKTGMFICKKLETKRRRKILNMNGVQIGYTQIELLKNKNKLYKKNDNIYYDMNNCLIYYNNDVIIGKIVYNYDESHVTNKYTCNDIFEIDYLCNPFVSNDGTWYELPTVKQHQLLAKLIDRNVNCINVCFTVEIKINRQRFYEKLIQLDYICKYKPESYSGVKWIYKIPATSDESTDTSSYGYCKCTTKCTCTNITFLIFQSGKIIATGFKSEEQIANVCNNFVSFCNETKKIIQKKILHNNNNEYNC
jgi:hypothetical protein